MRGNARGDCPTFQRHWRRGWPPMRRSDRLAALRKLLDPRRAGRRRGSRRIALQPDMATVALGLDRLIRVLWRTMTATRRTQGMVMRRRLDQKPIANSTTAQTNATAATTSIKLSPAVISRSTGSPNNDGVGSSDESLVRSCVLKSVIAVSPRYNKGSYKLRSGTQRTRRAYTRPTTNIVLKPDCTGPPYHMMACNDCFSLIKHSMRSSSDRNPSPPHLAFSINGLNSSSFAVSTMPACAIKKMFGVGARSELPSACRLVEACARPKS